MVAFGHTSVGAAIGIICYQNFHTLPTPEGLALTLGAGIISHYIADFIPHGHFFRGNFKANVGKDIIFDLFLSIILFSGIALLRDGVGIKLFYVLFGIGGAQLPDIVDGLMYTGYLPKKGFLKIENKFHQAVHWHGAEDNALLWGKRDIWQITLTVVSLALLFIY